MKYYLQISFLSLLVWSCQSSDPHLHNITDPQLSQKVLKYGNRISSQAQQALGSNLMYQIKKNGSAQAVEFCNLAAYPILDSLSTPVPALIKRAAIKARNPMDLPTAVERKLIEDYIQALKNKQPLQPKALALSDDAVMFAAPIQTKNSTCLQCHGKENEDIQSNTLRTIQELYPDDIATGHEVGDIRGIWSIVFKEDKLLAFEETKEPLTGLQLIEQNCYACHNPKVKSHDAAIAPPMVAVKKRYMATFTTEALFKEKMISFLQNPSPEKAIMQGPVRRFGVMPGFQYSEADLRAMVDYLYHNDMESPDWFEAHYREMHGE